MCLIEINDTIGQEILLEFSTRETSSWTHEQSEASKSFISATHKLGATKQIFLLSTVSIPRSVSCICTESFNSLVWKGFHRGFTFTSYLPAMGRDTLH